MSRCKPAVLSMFLMATTASVPGPRLVAPRTSSLGARAPEAKDHAPYPNSAQGLKQQLKDMRELARSDRSDQLRGMITDLEIPDARAWYSANFGTSGMETANLYENNLTASEARFKNQIVEFAREDGYFSVKRQDAKKVYPRLVTAPEVSLGSWGRSSVYGEHPVETPFGYFFFIDGKFRWDSTIMWVTVD
jgi:hypothetical protein